MTVRSFAAAACLGQLTLSLVHTSALGIALLFFAHQVAFAQTPTQEEQQVLAPTAENSGLRYSEPNIRDQRCIIRSAERHR